MADEHNQSPEGTSNAAERARKRARVRGMTDPLGSLGFRKTPERYRREARARRGVFGGAAASFVIGTALIIAANERGAESAPTTPVTTVATSQAVSSQGAPQPQSATSNATQSTSTATSGTSGGIVGEANALLSKPQPSQGNALSGDDDDRYDDDDDHDDDHDDEDHDDDDEDDDHGYGSSAVVQNQASNSSSNSAGASGQNEIVIDPPAPHTQTGSTGD